MRNTDKINRLNVFQSETKSESTFEGRQKQEVAEDAQTTALMC